MHVLCESVMDFIRRTFLSSKASGNTITAASKHADKKGMDYQSKVLLVLLGYQFDKECTFTVFPRELINLFLCLFMPTIEMATIANCSYITLSNSTSMSEKTSVISGPSVGGWMATNQLRNYCGVVTFIFEQRGTNERNFWSCIGVSAEPQWTGPGYDYDRNRQFSFYYRLDIGAVDGVIDVFPHVNNSKSNITTITVALSPRKLKILECDKYEMSAKHQALEFTIPEEYYLLADFYYVDTICTIREEYNWKPGQTRANAIAYEPPKIATPKIVPNEEHLNSLAIMFEHIEVEVLENALIEANNNLEAAVNSLLDNAS